MLGWCPVAIFVIGIFREWLGPCLLPLQIACPCLWVQCLFLLVPVQILNRFTDDFTMDDVLSEVVTMRFAPMMAVCSCSEHGLTMFAFYIFVQRMATESYLLFSVFFSFVSLSDGWSYRLIH